MILGGDVGGTKCNLALVAESDGVLRILFQARYPSHEYKRFEDLLATFLRDAQGTLASGGGGIQAAGFGVAGPVVGRGAHLTNLGWDLDASAIERQLNTRHVVLLNDLEATGYSLARLAANETYTLNSGAAATGAPMALLAAGTGLGEAALYWSGSRYVVEPSEGGHCDFAPRTDREIELLRFMKKTHPRVSFELVLSGRGFYTIHQFLGPAVRHPSFDQPNVDPAPEITRLGLEGSCSVCVETLNLWVALYGAEAGNLALRTLARGGVFVAGGIAVKLLPKMKDGTFFRAFCEKEKFEDLLSQVPVKIVLNEEAPLIGAAREALRVFGESAGTA